MRLKAPITLSAIVVAGLVTAGSSASGSLGGPDPKTPPALLSAAAAAAQSTGTVALADHVGVLPSSPKPARKLRAASPVAPSAFAAGMPLKDVAIPGALGALGIPEIVLAAYRNAELALAQSDPNCGISWNLLAGIGRIESGHANSGRTDAAGTTLTRILGPTLDGSLAGNNVIHDTDAGALDGDNGHDRAVGPMQFIPSTWKFYASDGNADGVADPNNVFDAALSAGKYLCSGGLNLRDPAQELRAVLRYNNSMAYAANVLSWSAAYRAGGTPATVQIPSEMIAPGTSPIDEAALAAAPPPAVGTAGAAALPPGAPTPSPTTTPPSGTPSTTPTTTEQMITIPGLPPFPCGILCPPPPPPPTTTTTTPAPPAPPAPASATTTTTTPPPPPPFGLVVPPLPHP